MQVVFANGWDRLWSAFECVVSSNKSSPISIVVTGSKDLQTELGLRIRAVVQDPEIVLGVLIVGLRDDAVAARAGVARQGQVLLVYLAGVAPDSTLRAAAVEVLASMMTVRFAVGPATGAATVGVGLSHSRLLYL